MILRCSENVAALLRPAFASWSNEQEGFAVLLLDSRNRPIGEPLLVALGTADGVSIHPRDVFREAIRRNAVSIIVAHNHPSGDVDPSDDDRALTQRLLEAGKLLGVPLLDHVIVAESNHYSFADRGLL